MDAKQELINRFQYLIKDELEALENIKDKEERQIRLNTLYKINMYLSNFDELEPTLKKFFKEKAKKDKWEVRWWKWLVEEKKAEKEDRRNKYMNEKIKKIAKYTTNILAIISALVAGINAVEGITIPYTIQTVQIIAVIQGVIGTYLLGNKAVEKAEEKKEE